MLSYGFVRSNRRSIPVGSEANASMMGFLIRVPNTGNRSCSNFVRSFGWS